MLHIDSGLAAGGPNLMVKSLRASISSHFLKVCIEFVTVLLPFCILVF